MEGAGEAISDLGTRRKQRAQSGTWVSRSHLHTATTRMGGLVHADGRGRFMGKCIHAGSGPSCYMADLCLCLLIPDAADGLLSLTDPTGSGAHLHWCAEYQVYLVHPLP